MTSTLKKTVVAALAAATMSMGATTAHAVGGVNSLASFEAGKSVEQVQSRFRSRGFRGNRGFRSGRSFRGGRSFRSSRFRGGRSFRGRNRGRNIGIGLASGFLIGSILYSQRHHYSHSSLRRHVAWCSKRYKTYNVRSDTFISYKHGKKRCNSPYI